MGAPDLRPLGLPRVFAASGPRVARIAYAIGVGSFTSALAILLAMLPGSGRNSYAEVLWRPSWLALHLAFAFGIPLVTAFALPPRGRGIRPFVIRNAGFFVMVLLFFAVHRVVDKWDCYLCSAPFAFDARFCSQVLWFATGLTLVAATTLAPIVVWEMREPVGDDHAARTGMRVGLWLSVVSAIMLASRDLGFPPPGELPSALAPFGFALAAGLGILIASHRSLVASRQWLEQARAGKIPGIRVRLALPQDEQLRLSPLEWKRRDAELHEVLEAYEDGDGPYRGRSPTPLRRL